MLLFIASECAHVKMIASLPKFMTPCVEMTGRRTVTNVEQNVVGRLLNAYEIVHVKMMIVIALKIAILYVVTMGRLTITSACKM